MQFAIVEITESHAAWWNVNHKVLKSEKLCKSSTVIKKKATPKPNQVKNQKKYLKTLHVTLLWIDWVYFLQAGVEEKLLLNMAFMKS